jgi:hypothetical protein
MRCVFVTALLAILTGIARAQECSSWIDFSNIPTTTMLIPQQSPSSPGLNGNKYWQINLCRPETFSACPSTPGNVIEINDARTSCDETFIASGGASTTDWSYMYGGINGIFYGQYSTPNDRVANVTVYCDPYAPVTKLAAGGANVLAYPSPADNRVWNFNIELKSYYACGTIPTPHPQYPPITAEPRGPPLTKSNLPLILLVGGCIVVIVAVVVVVYRCVRRRRQSRPDAASLLSGSRSAPVTYAAPSPAAAAAPALYATSDDDGDESPWGPTSKRHMAELADITGSSGGVSAAAVPPAPAATVVIVVSPNLPKHSLGARMLASCTGANFARLTQFPLIVSEAHKIAVAKLDPTNNPVGLNEDEIFAVVLYTYELGPRSMQADGSDNFYFVVNDVIRKAKREGPEVLRPLAGYFACLDAAWPRLPPVTGRFYRGLPRSSWEWVRSAYQSGAKIEWTAITSVSAKLHVAERFAAKEGAGGIVFDIKVNDARDIALYSAVPAEFEVLLKPNSRFVVLNGPLPPLQHHRVGRVERARKRHASLFLRALIIAPTHRCCSRLVLHVKSELFGQLGMFSDVLAETRTLDRIQMKKKYSAALGP